MMQFCIKVQDGKKPDSLEIQLITKLLLQKVNMSFFEVCATNKASLEAISVYSLHT